MLSFTTILLWTLLLSACQQVQIKDETIYGLKGPLGVRVAHTLSSTTATLTPAQWNAISFGMVCENSTAWADIKQAQEQACQQCNCCTAEVQAQFDRVFGAVDRLELGGEKLSNRP